MTPDPAVAPGIVVGVLAGLGVILEVIYGENLCAASVDFSTYCRSAHERRASLNRISRSVLGVCEKSGNAC
jgi:hypothetical protein